MSVGRGLIATGAVLAAMSVAAFSIALSAPAHASAEPMSCLALRVGWTVACAPYPAQSRRASSLIDAYGCTQQ